MWQGIYFQKMENLIQLRNKIVFKKLRTQYTNSKQIFQEFCDIKFDNKKLFDFK